jgi:hypothetical protein
VPLLEELLGVQLNIVMLKKDYRERGWCWCLLLTLKEFFRES